MKTSLDKRLLIINTDKNCDHLIFMKNECKETKKIMYSNIIKIRLSPKDNPKFDIIIQTKTDTV